MRVDEALNPPASRALGILVIEVQVAPTTPAEFVVFRIIQQPGRPPGRGMTERGAWRWPPAIA